MARAMKKAGIPIIGPAEARATAAANEDKACPEGKE